MNKIKFAKCRVHAKLPIRGSEEAAGLDLFSAKGVVLYPQRRELVPTGIKMQLPKGHAGLIWPRSKLSNKFGIDVLAGVIDEDYTGEIHVILLNTGVYRVDLEEGEAIAQLVVQEIIKPEIEEVDELDVTVRGEAGILSEDQRRGLT